LNAADYGVAQIRHRVIIVATRADAMSRFKFPPVTHSLSALLSEQSSGRYWERHSIPARQIRGTERPSRALDGDDRKSLLPWRTVRDELTGLEAPASSERTALNNHWEIPGARAYAGHDGSSMDSPAKTIKAGVHGVPGGENTVRLDNGKLRYLTLRETAVLQGFPLQHVFIGARSNITRQIGNAVPCPLAEAIGRAAISMIESAQQS
jgi:DNA (cytosine-5)-methyltransferase 1